MVQRKRKDNNHNTITGALERIGATVKDTSSLGGFCDIVVGYRGKNYLFEIKNPEQSESGQKLTPDEKDFHDRWRGQVNIITTFEDALKILNIN